MALSDHNFGTKLLHNIADAAEHLAEATKNEMALEHGRPVVKMQAIAGIIKAGDNPLTGKPHSFSSAEMLVEQDPVYAAHLAKLREAVENRILARGRYDAALVEAQMHANSR